MDRVILLKVYFILLLVKIDIGIDYHETDNIKGLLFQEYSKRYANIIYKYDRMFPLQVNQNLSLKSFQMSTDS